MSKRNSKEYNEVHNAMYRMRAEELRSEIERLNIRLQEFHINLQNLIVARHMLAEEEPNMELLMRNRFFPLSDLFSQQNQQGEPEHETNTLDAG